MTTQRIKQKRINDLISKSIIFLFAISGIVILLLMFFMILKEAVPAYKNYGLFHMYFTSDFSESGNWGIWGAMSVTLVTAILAVLIALPIALRAAFFIKFRMIRGKKIVKLVINILAGVPSVVFGIFALSSLTAFTSIFGFTNTSSIFMGIIVLIIMIFPTLVSLISNQLELVPSDLINASLALGNTKTHTMYKVVKKSIKQGVYVSAIIALGRALGETMALSMILNVAPLSNPFVHGLGSFLHSSGATLGVMIARNMFSDSSDPNHRSVLFAAGIALFIAVMVLIAITARVSKGKKMSNKNPLHFRDEIKIEDYPAKWIFNGVIALKVMFLPLCMIRFSIVKLLEIFSIGWEHFKLIVSIPIDKLIFPKKKVANREYFIEKSKHKWSRIPDRIRETAEVISLVLILGSIVWICLEVFTKGLPNWKKKDWQWSYYEWTYLGRVERPGVLANTLVFTVVLVILTILISLPISLASALYLSEYARNKKIGNIIKFFLDSLGGTPSILFGMFGIIFFRQILGIGNGGFSLVAGALTMVIVIIPTFTRSIEQVLTQIPDDLRMASYSLGASKFETIKKVIIPQTLPGIIIGVILSSGRVIAETAPVYLTIGMLGNVDLAITGQGWTMTTKILYNQVFSTSSYQDALRESYAIASAALLLVTVLILFAESIKPIVKYRPITNYFIKPIKTIIQKGVKYARR